MYSGETTDTPHWYAVYTHPKQEARVNRNLQSWGVETFNPCIKESRLSPFIGSSIFVIRPLFARYVFARFDPSRLHNISFTRGVRSVVGFGGRPAIVDDEIIEFIQAQVGADGLVGTGEQLEYGDNVQIKGGPFESLSGIFERNVKDRERVMILLAAIKYQGRVIVERRYVEKTA